MSTPQERREEAREEYRRGIAAGCLGCALGLWHEDCEADMEPTTEEEEDSPMSLTGVVLRVPCPRCGESTGYPCRDLHDQPAGDPHVQRWGVAQRLGLITLAPLPAHLHATILEGALG